MGQINKYEQKIQLINFKPDFFNAKEELTSQRILS
jgi:hypothetical protein